MSFQVKSNRIRVTISITKHILLYTSKGLVEPVEPEVKSNVPLEEEQQQDTLAIEELRWQERDEVLKLQEESDVASGNRPKRLVRRPAKYLD